MDECSSLLCKCSFHVPKNVDLDPSWCVKSFRIGIIEPHFVKIVSFAVGRLSPSIAIANNLQKHLQSPLGAAQLVQWTESAEAKNRPMVDPLRTELVKNYPYSSKEHSN